MNRSLLFFILLTPLSLASFLFLQNRFDQQRDELEANQAKVIQHDVQERLQFYISGTRGARLIAATFWQQQEVNDREYQTLASRMMEAFPEIMGVNEVNPQGLIVRVHPRETNLSALGKTSQNTLALQEALARGENAWFSPPFELFQGGRGFVSYLALYQQGVHKGWLAVVVSTQKFFEFFTANEFGKNFDVSIIDVKTGESYVTPVSQLELRSGAPLFTAEVSEFGRPIRISVWPRQAIQPPRYPWLWPTLLALLFSTIATLAFRWWNDRLLALKRL